MLGYTQQDMSSIIGCSRKWYLKKENGSCTFSQKERELICEIFKRKLPNLTMEELFPVEG